MNAGKVSNTVISAQQNQTTAERGLQGDDEIETVDGELGAGQFLGIERFGSPRGQVEVSARCPRDRDALALSETVSIPD